MTTKTVGSETYIALKDAENKEIKVNGKQVYLKISGWGVTADTDKGYLGKHIETSWQETDLGFPWNYSTFHRSYWAEMPTAALNKTNQTTKDPTKVYQTWYSYNTLKDKKTLGTDGNNCIYVNENTLSPFQTATEGDTNTDTTTPIFATKVVMAGVLGTIETGEGNTETFTPLTLCKWMGQDYAGEDVLKAALLEALSGVYNYNAWTIKEVTDSEGNKTKELRNLTKDDIQFTIAETLGKAQLGEDNKGRYYVYAQLTDAAKALTWYSEKPTIDAQLNVSGGTKTTADAINTALIDNLGPQTIYSEGQTYYYFPIKHLAIDNTKTGYYGVVRNHIYDCKITKIAGLGTAVYDPTKEIYPEKPVDEYIMIAAEIKIESWRVVYNEYELVW